MRGEGHRVGASAMAQHCIGGHCHHMPAVRITHDVPALGQFADELPIPTIFTADGARKPPWRNILVLSHWLNGSIHE